MSASPAFLQLQNLTLSESTAVAGFVDRLERFNAANFEAHAYYEAKHVLQYAGETIPAHVASRLAPAVGAPGIVVDVLDERLDFLGWDDQAGLDLSGIYDLNELDAEGSMAHLDALIFGTSFVRVGERSDGGQPLVTVHSPMLTTGTRDPETRRMSAAWTTTRVEDGRTIRGVLDLPDVTITVQKFGGKWSVVDRYEHGRGRVCVVQMTNRRRASRLGGRSEITRTIRSLTDDLIRAGLGMSANSMFYSIPQLMILGRGPEAFKDRAGNPLPGWRILAGHALAMPKDKDGDVPKIHQVDVASPAPFIEQLREYRMQVASEAGIPADYLGIQTANPPSADAIGRSEVRLVKRAERRQLGFGRAWQEVARCAVLVRDGSIPSDFDTQVSPEWVSPSTPTRAATADEVTKLVGAGVLSPTSEVTYRRLGLSRAERRIIDGERTRANGAAMLDALRNRAGGESAPAPVTDDLGG